MQEGQCGGDTRYRTGNPTEALLVNVDASRCGAPVSYSSDGPTAIEVYQK
jgi:hypothetical protein